jgi:hypothetical protein
MAVPLLIGKAFVLTFEQMAAETGVPDGLQGLEGTFCVRSRP